MTPGLRASLALRPVRAVSPHAALRGSKRGRVTFRISALLDSDVPRERATQVTHFTAFLPTRRQGRTFHKNVRSGPHVVVTHGLGA